MSGPTILAWLGSGAGASVVGDVGVAWGICAGSGIAANLSRPLKWELAPCQLAVAGEFAGTDWVTPTGVVNTDWPAQNVQGNKIAKRNFGRMMG